MIFLFRGNFWVWKIIFRFTSLAGERYDFVITADQPVGAYWIQLRGLGECGIKRSQQLGILRYARGALSTGLGRSNLRRRNPTRRGKYNFCSRQSVAFRPSTESFGTLSLNVKTVKTHTEHRTESVIIHKTSLELVPSHSINCNAMKCPIKSTKLK